MYYGVVEWNRISQSMFVCVLMSLADVVGNVSQIKVTVRLHK